MELRRLMDFGRFQSPSKHKKEAMSVIDLVQDGITIRVANKSEIASSGFLAEKETETTIADQWDSTEKVQYFIGSVFDKNFFIAEVTMSRTWGLEELFIQHIKPLPGDCKVVLKMMPSQDSPENHYLAYVSLVAYLVPALHINRIVVYLLEHQKSDAVLLEGLGCSGIKLDTPKGDYDMVYIRAFTQEEKRIVNIVRKTS